MAISLAEARRPASARVGWTTYVAPEWEVDVLELRAVVRELGLEHPVVCGPVEAAHGRHYGLYRFVDGEHRISLRRRENAEQAGRTLWHELCHAVQQERGERTRGTSRLRGQAYELHPREVEARSWEARHATRPLIHAW